MLQGGPSAPRTRNSPYARPSPPNRAPAFAPRPNNNFAPRPNFYHNRPQYAQGLEEIMEETALAVTMEALVETTSIALLGQT